MAQVFGLDIGRHAVKGVAVERSFRQRKIGAASSMGVDDPTRAAETAARMLERMGYDPDEDTLALVWPGGDVTARIVTMPVEGRRKILESLPYELETLTPFEAERLLADYLPRTVDDGGRGSSVAAIATLREPFETRLADLLAAGVSPDIITPLPVLTARMTDGATYEGVVELGGAGVSFTLTGPRGLSSFHTADLALPTDEGDDAAYDQRVAMELRRLTYGLAADDKPTRLRFIGGGATPERAERIGALLSLPVAPPLYPDADGVEGPIEADGSVAAALTLALASAGDGSGVNFRHGRYEKKRSFAGVKTQGLVAAGLLALVAFLSVASFTLEGMRLSERKATLDKQVRSAFLKAMPGTPVVAEGQQLTAELARLRQRAANVGAGVTGGDPVLLRLSDISGAIPRELVVDVERLVYEPGQIALAGRTAGFDEVEGIKKALAALPWAEKVEVGDAKTRKTGEGGVTFRIEMEVAR